MKASPQARINRRVLFLSVAVAGAAAVAYRAATPSPNASPLASSAAPDHTSTPSAASAGSSHARRASITPRTDLPKSVLQPYPTQPATGEDTGALPPHDVRVYGLKEADKQLTLRVLTPAGSREGWSSELTFQGGLVWQHAGDSADAEGLITLQVPAQRLKSGRYALSLSQPGSLRYLYLFDVKLDD